MYIVLKVDRRNYLLHGDSQELVAGHRIKDHA